MTVRNSRAAWLVFSRIHGWLVQIFGIVIDGYYLARSAAAARRPSTAGNIVAAD